MAAKLGAQAPGAANYLLEPNLMAENLNMSHPTGDAIESLTGPSNIQGKCVAEWIVRLKLPSLSHCQFVTPSVGQYDFSF